MTIKIGGTSFPTRKPKELDAALIAVTGCSAAETAAALGGNSTPGRVAIALHPFLGDDAPERNELAVMIESALAEDGNTVIVDVRRLYGPDAPAAEKAD